jgi:hypothetical protein
MSTAQLVDGREVPLTLHILLHFWYFSQCQPPLPGVAACFQDVNVG